MKTNLTEKSFLIVKTFKNENLLKLCVQEVKENLKKLPIKMFGKSMFQPRLIGFFSNTSIGYSYSKQIANSQPLTTHLSILLDEINKKFDTKFNGILVNKYNDGNDYISAHSDDEGSISNVGVVSISYGSTRKLRIRQKTLKTIFLDLDMKSCDIIFMGGKFQEEFTHEIPKQLKIKEPRYSFTFRYHEI